MNWADVAGEAFTFLRSPTGWSVVIIGMLLLFALCILPTWYSTQVADRNTDRLERAINALGAPCSRSPVALRGQGVQAE